MFEAILATWRITNLLVSEDGPMNIFGLFRDHVGVELDEFNQCVGRNEFARGLCCFWCTSVWVGCALALLRKESILKGFSYSAGAIFLHVIKGELVKHGSRINKYATKS